MPSGTQPTTMLSLKNKGMPVHDALEIKGNMYIKIHIYIPKLSKKELEQIRGL